MACSTAHILDLFFNSVCNDKKELGGATSMWRYEAATSGSPIDADIGKTYKNGR